KKLKHPKEHKNPSKTKAPRPTIIFSQVTTKHHPKESSCVNTHIEKRISTILFGFLAFVHFRNNRRNIRLKKTCSYHQKGKPQIKRSSCFQRHRGVAQCHYNTSNNHRHTITRNFIGYPPSNNWS